MQKFYRFLWASIIIMAIAGCAASTTSAIGVSCDYSQGKPLWELPVDCQGGR